MGFRWIPKEEKFYGDFLSLADELKKDGAFEKTVRVKIGKGWNPANMRVVAFIQQRGQGPVLGAAMKSVASSIARRSR